MIKSFKGRTSESIFLGKRAKGLPSEIQQRARRKLRMLDASTSLEDMRIPPSNHLEALKGNRRGQHSIRINGLWRICFKWKSGNAHDVEIVDYH
jgi:proteic killer suppression protein